MLRMQSRSIALVLVSIQDTKSVRDECIVLHGEEKCKAFIESHNRCLKAEGFETT